MSSVVRPATGLTPDEGAAWWIARADETLSDQESAALDEWLKENEANAVAYRRASAHWALFEGSEDDPQLNALLHGALAEKPARRPRWKWAGAGGAAAACLATALLISPWSDLPPKSVDIVRSGMETAKGESRTITLADGSVVTLNTDSEISPAFSAGRRLLRLVRGQALFKVAHDASRPFVVEAGGRQVTALGTVFEVRLDPGRVQVTLVEGRVAVDGVKTTGSRPAPPPVILKPGQEYVAELGAPEQIAAVDISSQLRWREGFVEFDNVPLSEAVAEMNRYSERPLVVPDDRVAALKVSGVFKTSDPQRFAANMADLLPVVARTEDPAKIELASKAPPSVSR